VETPAVRCKPFFWAVVGILGLILLILLWFLIGRDEGRTTAWKSPFLRCPVAHGVVKDNFGAPRSDHTHYGDDILADWKEPVLAPFDGRIYNSESLGGLIVTLEAPDGSFVVGKHLSATTKERRVQTGDVIGSVGRLHVPGAFPHLHFEWHPDGGPAVDPFPYLRGVCPSTSPPGEVDGL
jgi:murein DD-endopeptidase MepM/ murein hydrolase activator NlpD